MRNVWLSLGGKTSKSFGPVAQQEEGKQLKIVKGVGSTPTWATNSPVTQHNASSLRSQHTRK